MKHAHRGVSWVSGTGLASAACMAAVCCLSLGGCALPGKGTDRLNRTVSVAPPAWNEPLEPFRITDEVFYVGTSGISAYLVATSNGLILLNCGTDQTVEHLLASIRQLGFDVREVKILVGLHGHYDHIGGAALLKRTTGAKFFVGAADRRLAESGGRDDPQFGDQYLYQPVTVDRALRDGDKIHLGGVELTVHATPGHTPGAITCTMLTRPVTQPLHVVFAGSMSCPDYTLVGNRRYPGVADDFQRTFKKLEALPCDFFLTEHGWDCQLSEKVRRLKQDSSVNPFLDPEGYRQYLERARARFLDLLQKQSPMTHSAQADSLDTGGCERMTEYGGLVFMQRPLASSILASR